MFEVKIPIPAKKIVIVLAVCIFGLIVAHVLGQYYKNFVPNDGLFLRVIDKFDLDLEKNSLPTWYQSSTLLLGAVFLGIIAFVRKNKEATDVRYWVFLSLTFLFLSVDEAVCIHEQMTMPVRKAFNLSGFLFLSWVIPAGIAVLILAAANFRFLLRLPSPTLRLFVIAGCVYLGGAMGIEMVNANHLEANHFIVDNPEIYGAGRFQYALLTALEEFLEMAGIGIFIYALAAHLNFELGFAAAKEEVSTVAETNSYAPIMVREVQPLSFEKGNYVPLGIADRRHRESHLG